MFTYYTIYKKKIQPNSNIQMFFNIYKSADPKINHKFQLCTTYKPQLYITYKFRLYTIYKFQLYTTYKFQLYTIYKFWLYTIYKFRLYTTYKSQLYTTYKFRLTFFIINIIFIILWCYVDNAYRFFYMYALSLHFNFII